jgi:hypothetical protein
MHFRPPAPRSIRRRTGEGGSMLLTAMLFAVGMAMVLGSYLTLSRTSLKVAHRTFFANDAVNLAEAGVEEALYCFNQMAAGTAPATAWTGWTISAANAMRTLPTFNRDQNAVGVVKVYVKGYDGSDAAPYIMSQAVVTPFDSGKPVIRTVHLALRRHAGTGGHGLVARNGFTLSNSTYADSYISNPTSSPTGPWLVYPAGGARNSSSVVNLTGTVTIAATAQVRGNLYLGAGVTPPAPARVTGTITPNYTFTVPTTVAPTVAGVSQSYNLGASIPLNLPRAGDLPAADGRYYYFTTASVRRFTVAANSHVTIVGTSTMAVTAANYVTLPTTSTLHVYVTGAFSISGTNLNAAGYAGALRIYTTTASTCTIGNNSQVVAWIHAPNATLNASGATPSNTVSGAVLANRITAATGHEYHFDESLPVYATYTMTRYMDFQSAADRATVAGLTGGYLQ